MKTITFRSINLDDIYDQDLTDEYSWSRVYEYPLVVQEIKKLFPDKVPKIHNSSSGFSELHNKFKSYLETCFGKDNCTHTDIITNESTNTSYYDITTVSEEFANTFDVVLNISTLEEIKHSHVDSIKNLYHQVKPGGYLIITFDIVLNNASDVSGLDLFAVENYLGTKYAVNDNMITGADSVVKNNRWANLSSGILIIQK